MFISVFKKLVSTLLLTVALGIAFSENAEDLAKKIGLEVDIRAAVLVFFVPVLVLSIFQKEKISLIKLFYRLKQLFQQNNDKLVEALKQQTEIASGQYGYSQMIQWIDQQKDSFVRFAGELFVSRYAPKEMAQLLTLRAQAEDLHLQALCSASAFLSKMAPFFGMLATVIGMIQLMKDMEDFSKISESMSLAMQGTLYGLISFSLVYAPIQKFLAGTREQLAQRNEIITRWFVLITQQSETTYIQEEMKAVEFFSENASSKKQAEGKET